MLWLRTCKPLFQWQRAGQFHHFINHIPLAWSGQSIVKCSDSISDGEGGSEEGGELWRGREKNNYIYLFLSSLIYLNYFFSFALCSLGLSGSVTLYPQSWDRVSKLPPHCPLNPPSDILSSYPSTLRMLYNSIWFLGQLEKSQAGMGMCDSRIPCIGLIS